MTSAARNSLIPSARNSLARGAALAILLVPSGAFAMGEFSAGPWKGMAFFNNAEFAHCGMVGHGGPAALMFTLTPAGELKLGLQHGGMRYTSGKTFTGSIEINGGPANPRTFTAVKRNVLVAPIGPLSEAMAALKQAQKLRLNAGGITQNFEVASLSDALTKLAACVKKRGGA